MSDAIARPWISRTIAILIGIVGADGVLLYGAQLTTVGGSSFLLLLPLFALGCSLAGVLAAVGLWRFRWWGWWVGTWYGILSALVTLMPYVIFGRRAGGNVLVSVLLLLLAASVAYLFTPSVRASYRVTAGWRMVPLKVVGIALVCYLLFLVPFVPAIMATWFSR